MRAVPSINLPAQRLRAIRASGFYRNDPGYIDDPRFGKNVNDGKTYGGRVSVLLKPTDRLTIRGTAMLENLDSNGPELAERRSGDAEAGLWRPRAGAYHPAAEQHRSTACTTARWTMISGR